MIWQIIFTSLLIILSIWCISVTSILLFAPSNDSVESVNIGVDDSARGSEAEATENKRAFVIKVRPDGYDEEFVSEILYDFSPGEVFFDLPDKDPEKVRKFAEEFNSLKLKHRSEAPQNSSFYEIRKLY